MSERVPEPLEMSDTEILDWLNEWGGWLEQTDGTWGLSYGLHSVATSDSVRDVVRRAAACWSEDNRDF